MKTELTTEQSKHLIELGVPETNATVLGKLYKREDDDIWDYQRLFSLTDLLEILPNYIYNSDGFCNRQYLRYIRWCGGWHEAYYHCSEVPFTLNPVFSKKELIDALYELTVWCIKNKHLKL